jgi:hypothetical protein
MVPDSAAGAQETAAAEERRKASALHASTKSAETITNRILCLRRADWNPRCARTRFPNAFVPFRHPSVFFAPAFCARLSTDFLSTVNADSGSLIQ